MPHHGLKGRIPVSYTHLKGWLLANHPLYGNFLPHQMPYRSLALTPRVRSGEHPDGIDPTSLLLIERAQARYYDVDPARMPASLSGREKMCIRDRRNVIVSLDRSCMSP